MFKMSGFTSVFDRVKDKLGAKKLTLLLAACGIAAVLLVTFSEPKGGGDPAQSAAFDEDAYNASYLAKLQESLEQAISGVSGAGKTRVYITLERGVRYVYATENRSSGDESRKNAGDYAQSRESESSLVVIDGENGKQPVMLEREEPSVMGVAVVCEGANDDRVRQDIIELAATLCGVGTNRVKVVPMKIYDE